MAIEDRVKEITEEFKSYQDWEDRYKHLIGLGKELAPMDESLKTEENKVKGCQSQVWVVADLEDGKIFFKADSDASIAKGVIALLVKVYSGETPDEILKLGHAWLDEIGLKQHLSMNRANGLASMLKQISMYAIAFQTKIKMGLV